MSDYPEYLNPFFEDEKSELTISRQRKKRSGSFSNTLIKGFTNTLRKSFRTKSKSSSRKPNEHVEFRRPILRPPARPSTYSTSTLSVPPKDNTTYSSPALPRSRFRERLAKSHIPILTEQELDEANPFNRDEVEDLEVKPTIERPRRKKKRAPPPPGMEDSNFLQVPNSSSKWSLTSAETDISYSTYAPSECNSEPEDAAEEESVEVRQVIEEFNRDMKKLITDDTNNNVITAEEVKTAEDEQNNIPTVSETEKQVTSEISNRVEVENDQQLLNQSECEEECIKQLPKMEENGCIEEEPQQLLKNEIPSNGYVEEDDGLRVKTPGVVVALAEPEDTDLDTPPHACSTPVPKIRKNKLAKNEMLGYEH